MSGLGITVRCLASTRIERCDAQGEETIGEDAGSRSEGGLDETNEEEVNMMSGMEPLEHPENRNLEDDNNELGPRSPSSLSSSSSSPGSDTEDMGTAHHISCIQEAQL